jgi:hypothetical protein
VEDFELTLSAAIFKTARIQALRAEFGRSVPYKHLVLPELCKPDVLQKARKEIIHNVVAKYKETDLFKVSFECASDVVKRFRRAQPRRNIVKGPPACAEAYVYGTPRLNSQYLSA